MRKLIFAVLMFVIVFSNSGDLSVAYAASSGSQSAQVPDLELGNVFTFEQLGYSEKLMVGPFDSTSIFFSLPANTQLKSGTSVTLKYALAWSGSTETVTDIGVAGTLLVYFNDELIDTIVLNGAGETTKEIIIPDIALNAVDDEGRHLAI